MKKFIYTLGIVAAAFAFSACQKEKDVKENPSDKLVTITFTAEKAGLETRTAAVEGENSVSFIWTDEDVANMKLFTVGEDAEGKEVLTPIQDPTVTKVSNTKLTISASVAPGATYTFRAVLAGQWTNDGKKPRVKDNQSPSTTNYDPSADVLISDDMEVEVVGSGEENVMTREMEMVFRRPIVVNKMTLKNLTEGEIINRVVISANKNIAGSFTQRSPFGDKNAITINFNETSIVPANGQFPVYFTTIPGSDLSLTVEVTTDQFVYTKSFAEGKSINFNLGQFTTFGFALPEGVAKTALTLPLNDSMEWAITGEEDETTELVTSDLTAVQGERKIYASATKAYRGADGLKLGTSKALGSITTNEIDLSSAYYVAVDAKTYGDDVSQLVISIDGEEVFTSGNLTGEYKTYYADCSAATSASTVTIGMKGKRGYIKSLSIQEGESPVIPEITVTSDNPMNVTCENDLWAITYTVSHPTSGVSISATANVDWIHDFDYQVNGEVGFEVDAQESGAEARTGVITLSYTGAESVDVTVIQARANDVNYVFTKVTSLEGLTSGDQYVIVATSGTKSYALPASPTVSSGKITGAEIAVANNSISEAAASGFVWTLTKSGNYFTISDGTKNLYHSNGGASGTNLAYGTSTSYPWSISEGQGGTGVFKVAGVANNTVNSRGLLATSAGQFGGYALTNFTNSGYAGIDFYKKVISSGEITTVATPTFTVEEGTYSTTQSVGIECATEGASIYYTTDGTTPDNTKSLYSSALSISSTTTVKAIAIKDGVSSEVATATYTINISGQKTATLTITSVSNLAATYTDDKGNTWSASSDAAAFTSNSSYLHAGSGTKSVSHITLSSSAYSALSIKEIHVWAAAKASSGVTTKISINGSLLGESEDLGNTASSGGTEFSVTNSSNLSGNISVVISRSSAQTAAIYFNKLTVIYED